MIEEVLAGRRPGAILVDCGPGSFTGVRVGLAAAQGLAIGWGVPVAGYSSHRAARRRERRGRSRRRAAWGTWRTFRARLSAVIRSRPSTSSARCRPTPPRPPVPRRPGDRLGRAGAGRGARPWRMARRLAPRRRCRTLPPALRGLPPRPIYGRAPDAKPVRAMPQAASKGGYVTGGGHPEPAGQPTCTT